MWFRNELSSLAEISLYTHTHTHTHTYIYIYIYQGLDDLRECHFTGQLKSKSRVFIYFNRTVATLLAACKAHTALTVDARKFLLGNGILYLFRKYRVVRMMYLLEEFQLPRNLSLCLYHMLFDAGICVIFSVDVGYYLLQVYVFVFFRSKLKMTHV